MMQRWGRVSRIQLHERSQELQRKYFVRDYRSKLEKSPMSTRAIESYVKINGWMSSTCCPLVL